MLPISFFYHLCLYNIYLYVSYSTCVVVIVLLCSFSLCGCHSFDVEFGYWVCGESKRLFNPPSRFSRLGTRCPVLMSCHVYLCMCVLYGHFRVCVYMLVVVFIFISLYLWLVCYVHAPTFSGRHRHADQCHSSHTFLPEKCMIRPSAASRQ